uniref:C1 family peptidase n=1 Tax=uncultured Draconibacterium sp. TaxID=1573823 RepID=UPI003216CFAB
MKLFTLLFLSVFVLTSVVVAQEEKEEFTLVKELKHTPVISQGRTGTCWSFATTSFLESEIMRLGFPETKLSEMYFVHYNYLNKAFQYLLYHGNNNFGEGSLSHDVMNILRDEGMATHESFPGILTGGKYNHSELVAQLKKEAIDLNKKKNGKIDASDLKSYNPILKEHLGKLPKKVEIEDGKLSPSQLRDQFKLNVDDYVELSSFSHHPFYKQFVLEVPDNWTHALYYNLPLNELMEVMYYSINNGYTIAWDGDTSEKLFSHKNGKADVPKKQQDKVDQKLRQATFYDRTTTDDHLMHLVGLSKDSEGRDCFYTKNSWGPDSNKYGGYLHMTDDYVRLKTVGILVHKNAIPQKIKAKLGL